MEITEKGITAKTPEELNALMQAEQARINEAERQRVERDKRIKEEERFLFKRMENISNFSVGKSLQQLEEDGEVEVNGIIYKKVEIVGAPTENYTRIPTHMLEK